jgi:hypothetical protein
MSTSELDRVAELADRLADRTLDALERGELTTEQFRDSPDLALILAAANLLQSAGAEFPPNMRRLAEKAAEQTQI